VTPARISYTTASFPANASAAARVNRPTPVHRSCAYSYPANVALPPPPPNGFPPPTARSKIRIGIEIPFHLANKICATRSRKNTRPGSGIDAALLAHSISTPAQIPILPLTQRERARLIQKLPNCWKGFDAQRGQVTLRPASAIGPRINDAVPLGQNERSPVDEPHAPTHCERVPNFLVRTVEVFKHLASRHQRHHPPDCRVRYCNATWNFWQICNRATGVSCGLATRSWRSSPRSLAHSPDVNPSRCLVRFIRPNSHRRAFGPLRRGWPKKKYLILETPPSPRSGWTVPRDTA